MKTEQIIEEREDSVKMKMRFKRFLSGFMAVATLASVIIQPVAVSASELEPEEIPFEQQYAELKDVQDSLDSDEIVKANDIELSYGQEFDVEVDLSGIEGVDESKIKILFHEAKNETGTDFDTHTPDTYKAVYAVEPVSGHPAYRISRNITVKEPETEVQSERSSDSTVNVEDDTGDTEQSEEDSESHRETQNSESTADLESELTVSEVLEQAESNGIDLYAMEAGETVTFMAAAGNARSSQQVSVTRGAEYRYADYGYGTYLTYQYTVKFGNISATAYCVQPSKPGPGSGTYTINKVGDGKALAKVCYYGTKASGDDGFFTEENGYGNLSTGARFILVHLAASYANGSGDAFSGANSTAQNLAMKLYNYCISQPEIPDVAMSFSDADVKAYVDGNSQRTKDITFNADALQTITMKLPAGVQLHNLTTGKTSKAGESVEICGGTKFYLSAPLTQVSDVAGSWSATMKGSITKDYSAYKISTGSGNQDLALVFGEGVDDEKYVDFKVSWVQQASVKVIKKDAKSDAKLSGAVFGLYSDVECTKLITQLPATDENGEASVQITKTQDTVWEVIDYLLVEGKNYFLMEHEQYGKDVAYVVLDQKGNVLVDGTYNGFDDVVKQKILDSLYPPVQEQAEGYKPKLDNWQKYMENGEYLRSAEITEEANYNMIDGLKNNAAPKDKKNRPKESVLAKLNEKKEEIARRSGQKDMQQVMEEDIERKKR